MLSTLLLSILETNGFSPAKSSLRTSCLAVRQPLHSWFSLSFEPTPLPCENTLKPSNFLRALAQSFRRNVLPTVRDATWLCCAVISIRDRINTHRRSLKSQIIIKSNQTPITFYCKLSKSRSQYRIHLKPHKKISN